MTSQTFTIFDRAGAPVRSVTCPPDELTNQLGQDETTQPGDHLQAPQAMVDLRPQYAVDRQASYPPLQWQLDALWHAMHDGSIPRAEPFYSAILRVKEEFPKG